MGSHSHQDAVRSARKALANVEMIFDIAETFKVLGDQTRLKIVLALTKHELCVLDIASVLGISDSAVSHQLRLLKSLRLVKQRKEGGTCIDCLPQSTGSCTYVHYILIPRISGNCSHPS